MIQHLPPVTSDAIVAARAIVRDPASSDADVKNACYTLAQSTDAGDQTMAREIRKARLQDRLQKARRTLVQPDATHRQISEACDTLFSLGDKNDAALARDKLHGGSTAYLDNMIGTLDRLIEGRPATDDVLARAHVRPTPPKPSTVRGWLEVAALVILIAALVYIAAQFPKAFSDAMIVGDAAPMGEW